MVLAVQAQEPVCPKSPSVGNCPKKDEASPQTETPGGLVMQGVASCDCPSKSLKWDSRSCAPLSGVVRLPGCCLWAVCTYCGPICM
jgi:hypothetical protein